MAGSFFVQTNHVIFIKFQTFGQSKVPLTLRCAKWFFRAKILPFRATSNQELCFFPRRHEKRSSFGLSQTIWADEKSTKEEEEEKERIIEMRYTILFNRCGTCAAGEYILHSYWHRLHDVRRYWFAVRIQYSSIWLPECQTTTRTTNILRIEPNQSQ